MLEDIFVGGAFMSAAPVAAGSYIQENRRDHVLCVFLLTGSPFKSKTQFGGIISIDAYILWKDD